MDITHTCPPNQFFRKSYSRKTRNGHTRRILGRCIRSQTRYASPFTIDHIRLRGYRHTRRALKNCPTGYIKRASYVRYTKRGKHVLVPEQCIHDRGLPGKGLRGGPGIGPLRKGELAKFGYANVMTLSESERHAALVKAVKAYGSLGVWRKLNAVAIYTRRTAPFASRIFKMDMDWVRSMFGIKAF